MFSQMLIELRWNDLENDIEFYLSINRLITLRYEAYNEECTQNTSPNKFLLYSPDYYFEDKISFIAIFVFVLS